MRFEITYNIKASDLIDINVKDKKLMLKKNTGEKIMQIIKKTTVKFISVESSVYHCLLFLGTPLVMSGGVPFWP